MFILRQFILIGLVGVMAGSILDIIGISRLSIAVSQNKPAEQVVKVSQSSSRKMKRAKFSQYHTNRTSDFREYSKNIIAEPTQNKKHFDININDVVSQKAEPKKTVIHNFDILAMQNNIVNSLNAQADDNVNNINKYTKNEVTRDGSSLDNHLNSVVNAVDVNKSKLFANVNNSLKTVNNSSNYNKNYFMDILHGKKQIDSYVNNSDNNPKPIIPYIRPSTPVKDISHQADISLTLTDIDTAKELNNFELRFKDDFNESYSDDKNGEILISQQMSSSLLSRSALILRQGYVPTNFDLVYEDEGHGKVTNLSVPLISNENLYKLYSKYGGSVSEGGTILVELSDDTEDADIDVKHGKKVYLNDRFNTVKSEDYDFNYIMFLGVEQGNANLSFKLSDDSTVSKLVYVTESEVYYEPNYYFEKSDNLSFYEINPLNQNSYERSVDKSEIRVLGEDASVSNLNNNTLKVAKTIIPLGSRKYYEVKHLEESIFIGKWDKQNVEIPSEDYLRFILDQFDKAKLESSCMVQINLPKSKKVTTHQVQFRDSRGDHAIVDSLALDNDGMLYEDVSFNTTKIFVSASTKGIIDLKVSYDDGSVDYLKSFCSEDTYWVEQL